MWIRVYQVLSINVWYDNWFMRNLHMTASLRFIELEIPRLLLMRTLNLGGLEPGTQRERNPHARINKDHLLMQMIQECNSSLQSTLKCSLSFSWLDDGENLEVMLPSELHGIYDYLDPQWERLHLPRIPRWHSGVLAASCRMDTHQEKWD